MSKIKTILSKLSKNRILLVIIRFLSRVLKWSFWANDKLGLLLLKAKDWENAEITLKRAILLNDQVANVYRNLGKALWNLKKLPEASEVYRKSLQLEPNNPEIFFMLARIYALCDRWEEAIDAYNNGIVLCYRDTDSVANGVDNSSPKSICYQYFGLSKLLVENGNYDSAEVALLKAVQIFSKCGDCYGELGEIYAHMGRYKESIAAYFQADELGLLSRTILVPWWVYEGLGREFEEAGLVDEALFAYTRSLAKQPYNDDLYQRVEILLKISNHCDLVSMVRSARNAITKKRPSLSEQ